MLKSGFKVSLFLYTFKLYILKVFYRSAKIFATKKTQLLKPKVIFSELSLNNSKTCRVKFRRSVKQPLVLFFIKQIEHWKHYFYVDFLIIILLFFIVLIGD